MKQQGTESAFKCFAHRLNQVWWCDITYCIKYGMSLYVCVRNYHS